MAGKNTHENETLKTSQSGNALVVVLVLLVVGLVGAGIYLNMQQSGDTAEAEETVSNEVAENAADVAPAQGEETAETADAAKDAKQAPQMEIREGNPVVAKIGDKEIKRADVIGYIQKLPPQLQQLPPQQLFPMATVQVVNAELINKRAQEAKLENDPAVKAQLEQAKDQIIRSVYVQKQVEKNLTDERLQTAYAELKKNFPEIEEVKARHILVKEEGTAKDLIKQLKDGADFAALAKENSIDTGTKDKGGELNYVSNKEVVPEFAEAAFSQKEGEISKKPVKSQFGYHIIEVLDKRQRPAPTFEEAKPALAQQLQNVVLEEVLQKWRQADKVEVFDINGDSFEPAAGEEAPVEAVE